MGHAIPKRSYSGTGVGKHQQDEWDSQHGAPEKYSPNGKHLGKFDHKTGAQTKPADLTRKVER